MRRPQAWLSLALGLAWLLLATFPARGETYTELFIGGVQTENTHVPFSLLHRYANGVSAENCAVPGRIHLAINHSGTAGGLPQNRLPRVDALFRLLPGF
jgi:hypothetical protein